MSGALAERDFVEKLQKAGLAGIEVLEREPVDLEFLALCPLFTDDLIHLMRILLSPEKQADVATAIVVRGHKPQQRAPR